MRTLGVCLLASSISFNALATDISEVIKNYNGEKAIHKYLHDTSKNTAIPALPELIVKRFEHIKKIDQIKLEMALFANSRSMKRAELYNMLYSFYQEKSKYPHAIKTFLQSTTRKSRFYQSSNGDIYTLKTCLLEDNSISCELSGSVCTNFCVLDDGQSAKMIANKYRLDSESAYFTERAILKKAIKSYKDKNIIDFANGVDKTNTVISVDFSDQATEKQKNVAYNIMLHYTMPGILNKINIANFKDILTTKLLQSDGKEFFDKFISHQHFQDLIQKDEELRNLYNKLIKSSDTQYLNVCGDMIDLLIKNHIVLYNNYVISAYLHALDGVNNVYFIPKTLYQMITLDGLMNDDIYHKYNIDTDELSYKPVSNLTNLHKDYNRFIQILHLANDRVIKYASNNSLNNIVLKTVKSMKKSRYVSETLKGYGDFLSHVVNISGFKRLAFSYENTYTSLNFYNMISDIIYQEYTAPEQTWRVYHGGEACPITNDFSSSFSDGLFAGCINDSETGCAASLAFKSDLFYCDIKIDDQLKNISNFYLPTEHTILPMYGEGELHHVRTKVFQSDNIYTSFDAIPGFTTNYIFKTDQIEQCDQNVIFTTDPNEFKKVETHKLTNVNISNYVVINPMIQEFVWHTTA